MLTPEPNKLAIELGKKIRWGRKLTVAASAVAAEAVEKVAVKSEPSPAPAPQPSGNVLVMEILPGSGPLQRILFRSRAGHCWSYPYGYIAMIHAPSAALITLQCTTGDPETIEIHGTGLNRLVFPLCEHRVAMLCESNNPLVPVDGMIISEIKIEAAKPKNKKTRTG